jgi:hypothetical protein
LRADLDASCTRRPGLELRGANGFVRGIVSDYTSKKLKSNALPVQERGKSDVV